MLPHLNPSKPSPNNSPKPLNERKKDEDRAEHSLNTVVDPFEWFPTDKATIPSKPGGILDNLIAYAERIILKIKDTKKETEPEKIKDEIMKLIDADEPKQKDYEDLSYETLSKLCSRFAKSMVKNYFRYHPCQLNKQEKDELKNELDSTLTLRFDPLTKESQKFYEEFQRSMNVPDEEMYK